MVLILPVLAGVMFGAAGIFVRELTDHGMSSPTVLFLRVSFAALEMLLLILHGDRTRLRIRGRDLPLFLGTGLVGMLGVNLFYTESVKRITLSLAAVLLSMSPVFVVFIAAALFRERITRQKIVCMVLAMAGCVLASGLLEQSAGLEVSAGGILMGLAAALFYGLYSLFSRGAIDRGYHTYTVIFFSLLLVLAVMLPLADYEAIGGYLSENTASRLLFLLVHSLCTSILPYVFLTVALRYAEAGKVSILAAGGEPAAAVLFGWIFYHEIPTVLMFAGMAVTVAALALLCRQPKEKRLEAQGEGQGDPRSKFE